MKLHPAYIAGVMDSDGSFSIVKRFKKNTRLGFIYRPIIQITWKISTSTETFFEYLVANYGGNYYTVFKKENTYGKGGYYYKYSLEGKEIASFIQHILPYLQLKKIQAKSLLDLKNLRYKWFAKGKGNGNIKPKWVSNKEERLRATVRNLNDKNGKGARNG